MSKNIWGNGVPRVPLDWLVTCTGLYTDVTSIY